jgi:hypothetical protein
MSYSTAPNRTEIIGVVREPLTEEYMVLDDSTGVAELQPRHDALTRVTVIQFSSTDLRTGV